MHFWRYAASTEGGNSGGMAPVGIVRRVVGRYDDLYGLVSDIVGIDNSGAVELGVRHLVERGFRDVVFVVQPFERVSSRRVRERAFRDVVERLGVRGCTVVMDFADVITALEEVVAVVAQGGASGRKVAVFAANAPVALRLALHFKDRFGHDWHARVALLSIDDPDWAELSGMTAVRQPTFEIGARAVGFLHQRIEGEGCAARIALLEGELIVRASTE